MTLWALVPIKARALCKSRLAEKLSDAQRRFVVRRLLMHVVDALQQSSAIDHIAVVSAERDCVPPSIEVLPDRGGGLNSALTEAVAIARLRGATEVIIVLPDTALLTPADLHAMIGGMRNDGLALAPDRHDSGTNALAQRIAIPLQYRFGRESFRNHLAEARRQGLHPTIIRRRGLAFDLDTASDFEHLLLSAPPDGAHILGTLP